MKWVSKSATLCLVLNLVSCFGTDPKKLGGPATNPYAPVSNVDAFNIQYAWRDNSSDATTASTTVVIQGAHISSALFENVCSTDGSTCTCEFYQAAATTAVAMSGLITYSHANNTISCTIGDTTNSNIPLYKYVRVISTTNTALASGMITISTGADLTLSDILGSSLSTTKVRKIMSHTCRRFWVAGTYVNSQGVSQCVPGAGGAAQTLDYLYADYKYYIYSANGGADATTPANILAQQYQNGGSAICTLQIPYFDCSTSAVSSTLYGLYKDQVAPFTTSVVLSSNPVDTSNTVYGYAAVVDNSGNCPPGLIKIRPYYAVPPSITIGTPVAQTTPSSFINNSGGLNQIQLESADSTTAATITSTPMILYKQPGTVACTTVGTAPTCYTPNGGTIPLVNVTYTAQSPQLCAISASYLSGI